MKKRIAITAFLVVFGAGLAGLVVPVQTSDQDRERAVRLEFAVSQPDSPVAIRSTKSTSNIGAYGAVTIENLAKAPIKEVTFGVFVHMPGQTEKEKPHLEVAAPVAAAVLPGGTKEIAANVLSAQRLSVLAKKYPGAVFELGVVRAVLADGVTWSAPIERNRFSYNKVVRAAARQLDCEAEPPSIFTSLLAKTGLVDGGYFTCMAAGVPIWCENELESCTNHICADPKQCPMQVCSYVPGS